MREITKEQFFNGSTIDGRRIDKAMEDIVDRANAIEKRDMNRRFVQVQYVGGYTPSVGVTADMIQLPFMEGLNPGDPQNEYRIKGTPSEPSKLYVYTATHFFNKPVVIIGMSLTLITDAEGHTNPFVYGEDAFIVGKSEGDSADDLTVSISVDNPFLPENRALNAEVYHKFNFSVLAHRFNQDTTLVPTPDMEPSTALNGAVAAVAIPKLAGMVIDDQDLNIPISRGSRVRVSVVYPDYNTKSPDVGWGARPWEGQILTWTLTILEGAEE